MDTRSDQVQHIRTSTSNSYIFIFTRLWSQKLEKVGLELNSMCKSPSHSNPSKKSERQYRRKLEIPSTRVARDIGATPSVNTYLQT